MWSHEAAAQPGNGTLDLSVTEQTLHHQVTAMLLYELAKTERNDRTWSISSIRFSFMSQTGSTSGSEIYFSGHSWSDTL